MRPWWLVMALAVALAPPVLGSGAQAVLVNGTDRNWQLRTEDPPGQGATILLTLRAPGREAEQIRLVHDPKAQREITLAPGAELRFTHEEAPGVAVSRWFELVTGGGLTRQAQDGFEGFLHFHTYPAPLGWGADRTGLSGQFYLCGRPNPYRLSQVPEAVLVLEAAAPEAGWCVIL